MIFIKHLILIHTSGIHLTAVYYKRPTLDLSTSYVFNESSRNFWIIFHQYSDEVKIVKSDTHWESCNMFLRFHKIKSRHFYFIIFEIRCYTATSNSLLNSHVYCDILYFNHRKLFSPCVLKIGRLSSRKTRWKTTTQTTLCKFYFYFYAFYFKNM